MDASLAAKALVSYVVWSWLRWDQDWDKPQLDTLIEKPNWKNPDMEHGYKFALRGHMNLSVHFIFNCGQKIPHNISHQAISTSQPHFHSCLRTLR